MLEKILVIRHGALGDFIQSLGPFAAIRQHHLQAHIVLLTAPFLKTFAEQTGYFDEVWVDRRFPWYQMGGTWHIIHKIHQMEFKRIYDLQTSHRTAFYFKLLSWLSWRRPPLWSGHAQGCAFPHTSAKRVTMHTLDRQKEQLRLAGIEEVPFPRMEWATMQDTLLMPPKPYILIVPYASHHRPEKCWPVASYQHLIKEMIAARFHVALIGSEIDTCYDHFLSPLEAPFLHDLRGRTSLMDIVSLGRNAAATVGNDTGPMHLFAIAGAPSWVLFSAASDPALCAPRGRQVKILRSPSFKDLTPEIVWESIKAYLDSSNKAGTFGKLT